MRNLLLICSIIVSTIFVIGGVKAAAKNNLNKQDEYLIEKDINNLRAKIESLNKYKEDEDTGLGESYTKFYSLVSAIAHDNNSDFVLLVDNIKDREPINKYYGNSKLLGVKSLNIEIVFTKQGSIDDTINICSILNDLQFHLPFEIVNFNAEEKAVKFNVILYGV